MVKGKWPNQKVLDNGNLEEILGESIVWNECPTASHPLSENMGLWGMLRSPDQSRVPEETCRQGKDAAPDPAMGLRQNTPQILATLTASPQPSRIINCLF